MSIPILHSSPWSPVIIRKKLCYIPFSKLVQVAYLWFQVAQSQYSYMKHWHSIRSKIFYFCMKCICTYPSKHVYMAFKKEWKLCASKVHSHISRYMLREHSRHIGHVLEVKSGITLQDFISSCGTRMHIQLCRKDRLVLYVDHLYLHISLKEVYGIQISPLTMNCKRLVLDYCGSVIYTPDSHRRDGKESHIYENALFKQVLIKVVWDHTDILFKRHLETLGNIGDMLSSTYTLNKRKWEGIIREYICLLNTLSLYSFKTISWTSIKAVDVMYSMCHPLWKEGAEVALSFSRRIFYAYGACFEHRGILWGRDFIILETANGKRRQIQGVRTFVDGPYIMMEASEGFIWTAGHVSCLPIRTILDSVIPEKCIRLVLLYTQPLYILNFPKYISKMNMRHKYSTTHSWLMDHPLGFRVYPTWIIYLEYNHWNTVKMHYNMIVHRNMKLKHVLDLYGSSYMPFTLVLFWNDCVGWVVLQSFHTYNEHLCRTFFKAPIIKLVSIA